MASVDHKSMTSFDSYSFMYEWKIVGVQAYLNKQQPLQCPEEIKSPPGKYPATTWQLEALGSKTNSNDNTPTVGWRVAVILRSAESVWVRVELKTKGNVYSLGQWVDSNRTLSVSPSCSTPRTVQVYWGSTITGCIPFAQGTTDISHYYLYGNDLIIQCHIHVSQLEKPIHTTSELTAAADSLLKSPKFDLSQIMQDARHKDRYTDVTIVTSEKEFKAHKVVLVSQSAFFETRLEERWTEHGGNRIEMRDVPAVTMDTILTYMYTGKVVDIDKAAHELLPRADEYQLDGLKTLCEEALCKSLTAQSVIDILVMADTHNAPNLKKSCLTFIAKNISDVKKSSAWTEGKLKSEENKDLWVEVADHIIEVL